MWMKIVSCLLLVIVLNCDRFCCDNHVQPYSVHRVSEQPNAGDIKISKNVTIHRNGYGRLLRLLALLKGFHHRKHDIFNPYLISRLWRASFEFELKPHPTFENEIGPGVYYPTHQFGAVGNHGGPGNSGLGSNTIDSIFHFGNNEQQSSVTIGGSNQIVKGPDERDEIPVGLNAVNQDVSSEQVISVPTTEVGEKSERVLRHAIQPRADEQSDVDTEETSSTNTPTVDDNETTTFSSTTTDTTVAPSLTIPQTEIVSTEGLTETATTITPEVSSTISNKVDQVSAVSSMPPEWMGYYDAGILKPEFIQSIEFTTTNYPSTQLNGDSIQYVSYQAPFKPSLPDYSNNGYSSSNFFVPLLHYFKR